MQRFTWLRTGVIAATVTIVCLAPLAACQKQVAIDNPIPVADHEYDAVFNEAVATLRRHRFVVERQDRRFGVITTRPIVASSVLEPWRDDNTTAGQVVGNTLNQRRRSVRVLLEPTVAVAAPRPDRPRYELYVEVTVEQRQHPPRMLHTARAGSLASYERDPGLRAARTEQGVQRSFWRPIGRDPYLEQRLIAEIFEQATPSPSGGDPHAGDPPQAGPADEAAAGATDGLSAS